MTADQPAGDWTLTGAFGTEQWRRRGDRFGEVEVDGDRIVLPADALTLERLRARGSSCAHPGPFPLEFRFCPTCGATLPEPPPPPVVESWSPPFGAPDGLPTLDEPRRPDPASHQEIAVPASAALGFAVAGTPPMLLACDRVGGWVSGWSEAASSWLERVQIPPCPGLPAWSWSAGAGPYGLAVPTDRGAAWIELSHPRRSPVRLLDGFAALGGIAELRGRPALPVQDKAGGEAGLVLAVLDRSGPDAVGWTMLAVQGAPPPSAPIGPLAAPVTTGDTATWCGATGQLTLHATADGLASRWRGWRDGLRPISGVRPVMERNGTLHQLARIDARTLVLEGLSAPGQVPERRPARGYTPGTGRAVFREDMRLRLPWDERAAAEYILPDDSFLMPLLALDEERYVVAVCTQRIGLGRFLGDPAAPDMVEGPHACTLFYSRGPRTLEPLDCVLRARHAWDLAVFVHAGWLYAYGAVENRCHRWRMRDAG